MLYGLTSLAEISTREGSAKELTPAYPDTVLAPLGKQAAISTRGVVVGYDAVDSLGRRLLNWCLVLQSSLLRVT